MVSIADATLASPQPDGSIGVGNLDALFQSQTRRLLPRNDFDKRVARHPDIVSIADATLASPQLTIKHGATCLTHSFNRRRDACFPATPFAYMSDGEFDMFQSQTRRLLPRNNCTWTKFEDVAAFQSQTRRLLPRNV